MPGMRSSAGLRTAGRTPAGPPAATWGGHAGAPVEVCAEVGGGAAVADRPERAPAGQEFSGSGSADHLSLSTAPLFSSMTAWAAENRAIGTRNGEQDT